MSGSHWWAAFLLLLSISVMLTWWYDDDILVMAVVIHWSRDAIGLMFHSALPLWCRTSDGIVCLMVTMELWYAEYLSLMMMTVHDTLLLDDTVMMEVVTDDITIYALYIDDMMMHSIRYISFTDVLILPLLVFRCCRLPVMPFSDTIHHSGNSDDDASVLRWYTFKLYFKFVWTYLTDKAMMSWKYINLY